MAANWLPHEMTHSWNGKFRRPSGLATADYSESKGDLLWVYEGLTDYVGRVLASRSGMRTAVLRARRRFGVPARRRLLNEGTLIWLEADTLIRRQTKGAKSPH